MCLFCKHHWEIKDEKALEVSRMRPYGRAVVGYEYYTIFQCTRCGKYKKETIKIGK